ncbi:MAG: peptidylprolyl isomerase [Microbacteriaceae bacterium]
MSIHTQTATIHTNHGDIRVELFGNHAPITVENFVGLATGTREWVHPGTNDSMSTPLYDGVIFHRIIKDFMLQAGDPLGMGFGGPGYQFKDEIHPELSFTEPFILAMANAGPGTNGSQFFITTVPTTWLQGKHTIFGAVTDADSQKVVLDIQAVPTGANDKPIEPVVISSITIE